MDLQQLLENSIVYSANVGEYDDPAESKLSRLKFVCYTDKVEKDNRLSAKWYKMHPQLLFPLNKYAVWVDSSVVLDDKIENKLLDFANSDCDIGLCKHPVRDCAYEEAELFDSKQAVEFLELNNYPRKAGLFASGLIFYKLPTNYVFTHYWFHLMKYSTRDQITMGQALKTSGLKVKIMYEDYFINHFEYKGHK